MRKEGREEGEREAGRETEKERDVKIFSYHPSTLKLAETDLTESGRAG